MNAKQFIDEYGWAEAEQVASKAGTNRAYLSQIAHGHRNASALLAERLVLASSGRLDFKSLVMATPNRQPASSGKKICTDLKVQF